MSPACPLHQSYRIIKKSHAHLSRELSRAGVSGGSPQAGLPAPGGLQGPAPHAVYRLPPRYGPPLVPPCASNILIIWLIQHAVSFQQHTLKASA